MTQKILFCCNFYPPHFIGGAEVIAHRQAQSLQDIGYEVFIFCGLHDQSAKQYKLFKEEFEGIKVFRVILHTEDFVLGKNFANSFVDNLFGQVLETVNPSVVHFHNLIGLSLGLIDKARQKLIPTALTLHDYWGFCFKNTLLKVDEQVCKDLVQCQYCQPEIVNDDNQRLHIRLRRDYIVRQLNKVNRLISPSSYLAKIYKQAEFSQKQISVISNGIDSSRFTNTQKPKKRNAAVLEFTFIGHLGFHKGVHILLDSIKQLHQKKILGVSCKFNIVGSGSMDTVVHEVVQSYSLTKTVKVWGKVPRSQIKAVFENTDILVVTSVWPENEPVTILEAMAAEIPVLASAIGGNLDLVMPGVTGELFESGNSYELTEKITGLISNRQQIEEMGRNAARSVASNTLEHYVDNIDNVYSSLIKQKSIAEHIHDWLVICCGTSVSIDCMNVLDEFNSSSNFLDTRFVMSNWITPSDWSNAALLWVVDDRWYIETIKVSIRELVRTALENGIPLLVPNSNKELVDICRKGQFGLFYEDTLEAKICLEYLQKHPHILAQLSSNARLFGDSNLKLLR